MENVGCHNSSEFYSAGLRYIARYGLKIAVHLKFVHKFQ